MYKRFYDSLIAPKNIVEYRNDAVWKVLLYVLFFALLLSTRITIDTITFDGLSPTTKEVIKNDFPEVDTSCAIVDNSLSCDTEQSTMIYQNLILSVYIDSNDTLDTSLYNQAGYNLVVFEDKAHFIVASTSFLEIEISSLPEKLRTLDFSLFETNEDAFFLQLTDGIDEFLLGTKSIWGTSAIIFDLITNIFMFLLFILLSTWMLRIRFKQIKFKHLFVMTAYSSTALYLILIINSLYNLSFIIVIVLLLVAFRQNSQLSMELYRRLTKKVDKQ